MAGYVQMEDNGRLLLKATDKEPARIVPPLKDRLTLLKNAHRYADYPGADRLYQLVKTQFYWPNLAKDCQAVATVSVPRQKE